MPSKILKMMKAVSQNAKKVSRKLKFEAIRFRESMRMAATFAAIPAIPMARSAMSSTHHLVGASVVKLFYPN